MMKSTTTVLVVVGLTAGAALLPGTASTEPTTNLLSTMMSPTMILLGQNCSNQMLAFPKTEHEPRRLTNIRRHQQQQGDAAVAVVEGISNESEDYYYNTNNTARRRRTQFGTYAKTMEEEEDAYRIGRCTERMILVNESEASDGSEVTDFGVVAHYPIYDPDARDEEIGTFTGVAVDAYNPGEVSCTVQAAYSFDRDPETAYFDSQINMAWTCSSSGTQIPIAGGSGRYAGISGWWELAIPPAEGYAKIRLIICDEIGMDPEEEKSKGSL